MAPLRCAAKFDPFLSLDCAPNPTPWHNPRKGRDQILPSGNTDLDPLDCVLVNENVPSAELCDPGGDDGALPHLAHHHAHVRDHLQDGLPEGPPRVVGLQEVSGQILYLCRGVQMSVSYRSKPIFRAILICMTS